MKNIKLKIALIGLGLFGLCFLAWQRTDGFRSSAIIFDLPADLEKNQEVLKESQGEQSNRETESLADLEQILAQKFHYLGRGRQAFVFVSEDNQYVIKFFNFHHFYYPFFSKPPFLKDKSKRLNLTFSSYQLAFDRLPEETGLIYVHLKQEQQRNQRLVQQKPKFKTKIQLINPSGVPIKVDLNQTYFVVQKKAAPFFSHLTRLAQEKKLRAGVDAFLQTVVKRLDAKILDDDLDLAKNYGFIEGRAVNFDAGRLMVKTELSQELFTSELRKSTKMLFRWLEEHYPEESTYLESSVRSLTEARF